MCPVFVPKHQTCPSCAHAQELPAIFCGGCRSPLLRISKIFLTVFLTLTVLAFVYYGLNQERLLFAWPLFGYYALLFVTLSWAVTRRYQLVTLRMVTWSALLFYALWFFYSGFTRALTDMTSDVADIIAVIEENTFSQIGAAAVVGLEAILAFVLLYRRFGFATGYRVYATFLAAAAFAGRYAFAYATGETGAPVSVRLSDWFAWAPETEVKELFELVAVNILRAVMAEMAITSFIKSYRPATEAYQRFVSAAGTVTATGPLAPMIDAASRINAGLFRAAMLIRHFFTQFGYTLGTYLAALGRTLRRIFLDLVLPVCALAVAACLLGVLTEHSAAYITGRPGSRLVYLPGIRSSLAMIALTLPVLFGVQLLFLQAVTKFSPRALWRCNSLLLVWVAPFAVVLFFFVSLSLIATGAVVTRYSGHEAFPFHLGPLTIGAGVALVAMLVYGFVQTHRAMRRMALSQAVPGQEVSPLPPVEQGAADGAAPQVVSASQDGPAGDPA